VTATSAQKGHNFVSTIDSGTPAAEGDATPGGTAAPGLFTQHVDRRRFMTRATQGALGIGLAGPLALSLAGCGNDSTTGSTEDALKRGRKKGTLNLGFINQPPPDSYIDPKTGQLTGANPVILRAILEKIGIPHTIDILTTFDGVIPGLKAGRWDISAFNFYVTPDRCEQVAFTNPLVQYKEGAAVREGNPLGIDSYANLAAMSDVKVAIVSGAAEVGYAESAGIKNPQLFPDTPTVWQALKTGRVDVYLDAFHALSGAQKSYDSDGIELVTPFTGPVIDGKEAVSYSGWALRHSDVDLLNEINKTQAEMIDSGEIEVLDKPYGILEEGIPPGDITAKTLCPDAPWPSSYQEITHK
jgi:polar amino acid transport system substrate-binding protein